jgi:hypothetical protein
MNQKEWWKSPLIAPIFEMARNGKANVQATGAGEDGVIQPDNPVGTIDTIGGPKMLHEGEVTVTTPNGKMMILPTRILPQSVLRQMEDQSKMGGFETGGITQLTDKTLSTPKQDIPIQPFGGMDTQEINTVNPIGPSKTNIDNNSQTVNNINPIGPSKNIPVQPFGGMPAPIKTDAQTSTDVIRDYTTGNGPYLQKINNEVMGNFGASQAAGTAATKQELAMANAGSDALQTAEAVRQRDVDSQAAKLQSDISGQVLDKQLEAATTLNSIATNKDNTDYARKIAEDQTHYDRTLAAANTAFNSKDYTTASKMYNDLYGTSIDFSQLKTEDDRTNLASGMSDIDQYATTDMTDEQLDNIFKLNGVYDKTGFDKTAVMDIVKNIRLRNNPLTAPIMNMSDDVIALYDPTLPKEQYAQARTDMAAFVNGGGITYDADGNPVMNTDLITGSEFLSDFFKIKKADSTTIDQTTYEGYKTAGGTLSEVDWVKAKKPVYTPSSSDASTVTDNTPAIVNTPIGNTDDPATIVSGLASKGYNITEDAAQSFIDEMGRAPNSVDEFKEWDAKSNNVALWGNIDEKLSGTTGDVITKDGKNILDQSDIQGLVKQYESGDKKATKYFVNKDDSKTINSALKGSMDSATLKTLQDNEGKINDSGFGPYVIESAANEWKSDYGALSVLKLYNPNTGKERVIRYYSNDGKTKVFSDSDSILSSTKTSNADTENPIIQNYISTGVFPK